MKKRKKRWPAALCGLVAGATNGLFGAGGGMVLAPGLQILTDVEEERLFPTTLTIVTSLCLVSLTVYGLQGNLPWQAAWPYLIGSAAGGTLAGFLGKRIPTLWLHRSLGVILLLGAVRAFMR